MWKVEKVGEVDFDVECTPEEGSNSNKYQLKLNFDLDGEKLKGLLKSESVSVNSDVGFKAVSNWDEIREFTTGDNTVQMTIKNQRDSFHLRVELATLEEGGTIGFGGGEAAIMTQGEAKKFICNTSGLVRDTGASKEGTIFTGGGVSSSSNKTLMSSDDKKVNGRLSLRRCTKGSDGRSITCDLKL